MSRSKLRHILSVAVVCIFLSSHFTSQARKVSTQFKAPADTAVMEMTKGTFMVASQCEDCNKGYRLDMLSFFGFDKQLNSKYESFFITNNTDRTLKGISLYITYTTPSGNMLHKRFLKLKCDIPPGETRKADIESWDTQKSFYYHKSAQPKKQSTPFEVRFDLVAYYLGF